MLEGDKDNRTVTSWGVDLPSNSAIQLFISGNGNTSMQQSNIWLKQIEKNFCMFPLKPMPMVRSVKKSCSNNYPNDTSDGLIVCDNQPTNTHENKFSPALINTDEHPVTVAMINADGQWDPGGESTSKDTQWVESGFRIDTMTDKQLLDPPLQGGTPLDKWRSVSRRLGWGSKQRGRSLD